MDLTQDLKGSHLTGVFEVTGDFRRDLQNFLRFHPEGIPQLPQAFIDSILNLGDFPSKVIALDFRRSKPGSLSGDPGVEVRCDVGIHEMSSSRAEAPIGGLGSRHTKG